LPFYDRVGIVDRRFGFLIFGMLLNVLLNPRPREIVRVQLMPGRHGRRTRKRTVLVDQIPTAAHDCQESLERGIAGALVTRQSIEIALAPIDIVEAPAGFDELIHHLTFALRQSRGPERHIDVLPLREPRCNISILGLESCSQENHATREEDPAKRHHSKL
jgi:hypothetical protein